MRLSHAARVLALALNRSVLPLAVAGGVYVAFKLIQSHQVSAGAAASGLTPASRWCPSESICARLVREAAEWTEGTVLLSHTLYLKERRARDAAAASCANIQRGLSQKSKLTCDFRGIKIVLILFRVVCSSTRKVTRRSSHSWGFSKLHSPRRICLRLHPQLHTRIMLERQSKTSQSRKRRQSSNLLQTHPASLSGLSFQWQHVCCRWVPWRQAQPQTLNPRQPPPQGPYMYLQTALAYRRKLTCICIPPASPQSMLQPCRKRLSSPCLKGRLATPHQSQAQHSTPSFTTAFPHQPHPHSSHHHQKLHPWPAMHHPHSNRAMPMLLRLPKRPTQLSTTMPLERGPRFPGS